MIPATVSKRLQVLNEETNPRNLAYYIGLAETPDDPAKGYGEAIHLLNAAVALLLAGNAVWKGLCAKAARWVMAEYCAGDHHPFYQWTLLEWATRCNWLIGEFDKPCSELLWDTHEISYTHGDTDFAVEQAMTFLSRGLVDEAGHVLERAKELGPTAIRTKRMTASSACYAAYQIARERDPGIKDQLAHYLKSKGIREMQAGSFATAIPPVMLYRALLAPNSSPVEAIRLVIDA